MIRAIIIDDEPSAVNVLLLLLKKKCSNDVQILATSNSPHLGKTLIEQHQPDLVFLDVEMPGLSGIDLVRSFTNPTLHVVFVTAYDTYAVEAFRLSAIDYLLKPIEADDIVRLIEKIKKDINQAEYKFNIQLQNLQRILLQNGNTSEAKIAIAMADRIVLENIKDILYCEALGTYTNIYLNNGKKIVASKSLGDFESQLTLHKFFRIHHSTLINLRHIREFQRLDGYVIMANNTKLEVSQRKRKGFLEAIANDLNI